MFYKLSVHLKLARTWKYHKNTFWGNTKYDKGKQKFNKIVKIEEKYVATLWLLNP